MTKPTASKIKAKAAKSVPPPALASLPPAPSVTSSTLFSQYLRTQGKDISPLSDLGLQLQAQYIAEVGSHPLDILRDVATNVFAKPSERVAAAKALLEYSLRKVPAQMEITGKDGQPLSVHPSQLKNLSDEELSTLQDLLAKAQGA